MKKTILSSVAAICLTGGAALAQGVVLVPQGQGPGGQQQFILVPVPQDQAGQGAQQGAQGAQQSGQQGTAQGPSQEQIRERAEAMALDLYRRGYQRGMADAQSQTGVQIDPSAMEQIGRELFERGYMLGMMQARAQLAQTGQQGAGAGQAAGSGGQQGLNMQASPAPGTLGAQTPLQAGEEGAGQNPPVAQVPGQAGQEEPAQQGTTEQPTGGQDQQLVPRQAGVTPTTDFPEATIRADDSEKFGQYLTDDNGRAVYMFTADEQGQGDGKVAVSNCYGACAEAWPPVLTQSTPVEAGGPVQPDLLGTIEREGGFTQVTYNGWPLYYYVKDTGEGTATGQDVHGFGGEWYLVSPGGEKIQPK